MRDVVLAFSYICIYLTLGTSGSNVLYTTETYIGSHCTSGNNKRCTMIKNTGLRTKSIEPDAKTVWAMNKGITNIKKRKRSHEGVTPMYLRHEKKGRQYYDIVCLNSHKSNEKLLHVNDHGARRTFFVTKPFSGQHKDSKVS